MNPLRLFVEDDSVSAHQAGSQLKPMDLNPEEHGEGYDP